MKKCPACGAEIDDEEAKCQLCGYAFNVVDDGGKTAESISKKLEEMRARLKRLSEKHVEEAAATGEPPEPSEPVPPEREAGLEPEQMAEEVEIPDAAETAAPEPSEAEESTITGADVESLDEGLLPEEPLPESAALEEISEESEEEYVEEYEEVVVEEVSPITERPGEALGIPLTRREEPKYADKVGYKIRPSEIRKEKPGHGKKVLVATILIVAMFLTSWFFLFDRPTEPVLAIDNDFREWESVATYQSLIFSDDFNLDFVECAVQYDNGKIYWYFSVWTQLFGPSDRITSYALLIDVDGDSESGFRFAPDFGAELMVTISGSGGGLKSKMLSEFLGTDRSNWSAWVQIGTIETGRSSHQIETAFQIPYRYVGLNVNSMRFVGVSYDGVSSPSMTPFFSVLPGVLVVEQRSLLSSSCTVGSDADDEMLELTFTGFGKAYSIDAMVPVLSPGLTAEPIESIWWPTWDSMHGGATRKVVVDAGGLASETFVRAEITKEGLTTNYPSIMILGDPAVGYVGSIPAGITIDGCFSDWTSPQHDSELPAVQNPDIDILAGDVRDDDSNVYFFVDVRGGMLNGSLIPEEKKVPVASGEIAPPGGESERVTGEDTLWIFIDLDPGNGTGAPSPHDDTEIRPEYMIEVTGRGGMIASQSLYTWDDDGWTRVQGAGIAVAKAGAKIELGVSKTDLGSLTDSSVLIMMTDWLGTADLHALTGDIVDPFKVSIYGRVWWSADGDSWSPRTDVLPSTSSVVDMTADTVGRLYVAFSNGTVYRSLDAAASWSRLIEGSLSDAVGVTTDGASHLYLLCSNGSVFESPISGDAWSYRGRCTLSASNSYADIDWAEGGEPSSARLYVLRNANNAPVYYTTDGGLSWQDTARTGSTGTLNAVAAVASDGIYRLYVLKSDGDIIYSNNSGDAWQTTRISPDGSPDFSANPCVDLDTDTSGNLWVVRAQGEVYRLNVTSWTWTTVYALNDVTDITAFSTAPLPEFG